jgi:cysteine desulfurase family protein
MTLPEIIYLDHAATSWPKPPAVAEAMAAFLGTLAANAGRSGHAASLASARVLFEVRERLADLFGVADSKDLVYTRGTTEGINLVLKGILGPGDRVCISPLEHNAVVRPLHRLKLNRGVEVSILPADPYGRVDWEAAAQNEGADPPKLLVLAHGSNVNGVVQDLRAARAAFPDTAFLVDAAQTAGVLPVDVAGTGIDFWACSAHKGLLGLTGVGLCYLSPQHDIPPLMEGGTGSRSESSEQPELRPDRYESGTQNLHGIAGLRGVIDHLDAEGLSGELHESLTALLLEGLAEIPGVRLQTPKDGKPLLVSFTVEGHSVDEVASRLETEHGILCRPGLQCAPSAHRYLGTFPEGTVRLSPGFRNTPGQMEQAVNAVRKVAGA